MPDYTFNHVIQSVRRMKTTRDLPVILCSKEDHDWMAQQRLYDLPEALPMESFEGVPLEVFSNKDDLTDRIAELRKSKARFGLIYNKTTYVHG